MMSDPLPAVKLDLHQPAVTHEHSRNCFLSRPPLQPLSLYMTALQQPDSEL